MEYKINILFCILLFSGYSLTYKHSHGSKYKPRIYPNDDEVVVNANNNLKLRCEGKEPVKWTFPNNTVDYNYWSTVDVSTSETPDAEYIYGALLSLQNASYVDTGFYYCHSNRTEKDDYLRSNKIYVYVRDNTHLAVPNEQSSFLTVVQNTNTTLPCLPTSPDVIVSLKFNSEPVDAISYDPKVGFLLEIKSLVQSGFYTCNFTLNKQEEEQHFQLNVDSKTDYVSKPHIGSPNNGRTAVGQEYILNCTIRVDLDVYFTLNWTIPNKSGLETGRITSTTVTITKDNYGKVGTIMLIIKNVEYEDMGEYECIVTDHSGNTNNAKKEIIVYEQGESYINLTEKFGVYHISAMAGDSIVQWMINVDAFPEPQLTWHDNFDHEIEAGWSDSKSSKYTVVTSPTEALLKIHQINLNDSGIYRLIAANDFSEKSLNLTLTVNDKPTVHIVTDDYHKYGEDSNLICKAAGYPLPSVDWWFKPCQDGNCTFSQLFTNRTEINGLSTVSYLNITALSSGYVKCIAKNIEGEDSNTVGFYVTDINNGFDVWGIQDGAKVAVNETIIVHCAASVYNYTNNIYWYRWDDSENPKLIETDNQFNIEKKTTNYTHQISMTIRSISYDESGKYGCKVESKDRDLGDDYIVLSIIVTDPRKPKILRSNMNDTEIKITAGKPLEWYCDADGIPVPTISWTKNNEDWSKSIDYDRVKLDNDNRRLRFAYLLDDDEGLYSCKATNREGTDERKMQLIISSKSGITTTVIIIAISIVIVAILCTILLFKIKKEKKLEHELKVAGLNNFEKGDLDGINPELGVDDQAELLPYDKKWEFPRNKLKLGKQLGSGAFGVVMKADAFGIAEGETISTVAVKMVKRNADYTYIRALASELKIMVHLGKHLNVVNLLGACTKNVTKRELLVIVEYCRFGNLHNYLFRHRVDFVNQINPKTGNIDTTIGADILNRTLSVGSNHSDSARIPCAGVDYRATPNPSFSGTDSSAICTPPTGDDSVILSNNSVQPEWRSNYRGDYKGNVRPISTHDLLCWAFQVARGMDYLASRKVLHGDLAARNILLAEDNIVKICDFGLAKSMYKSDNYKKKGDGPLPVKWMSVESIRDRVFSTQSDVWSYGIVLWEFFSLARTPYPGMDADERLYNKLVDGYRMDQPEYATKEIYQTMLDCWHAKPTMRPSFTELSENLGCMLQESVRKHYIDLNDPYIHMNNERLGEGQSDYLAMLCSPDYGNLTSPTHNYVNDNISPPVTEQTGESSGYLPMDIFSPTNSNDNSVFDFDFHKKQKQNGEKASGIELMPILHPHVESDSEISPTMPSPSKSFTNPSYQTAPNIDSIIEIEPKNEQIIPTPDNYINMPQHKMKSDTKQNLDCFSNPSYVQMNNKKTTDNEKSLNYINSQSRDWERPYL